MRTSVQLAAFFKTCALCALLLFACACDNDVEVYGEYRETAVVFGLLDPSDDIVRIRIGKTYQGNGGAAAGAADAHNLSFRSLTVKLRNMGNGSEVTLAPNPAHPKDPGLFAAANDVYEGPPGFHVITGQTYRLIIVNNDNGQAFGSETTVIGAVDPRGPLSQVNSGINAFSCYPAKDSYACDMSVRIDFRRQLASDPSVFRDSFFIYPVSAVLLEQPAVAPPADISFSGKELAYQFRMSALPVAGTHIKLLRVSYIFSAGAREVRDYMSIFRPALYIAEKNKQYSNIVNGLGLFSSRHSVTTRAMPSPDMINLFKSVIPEFVE